MLQETERRSMLIDGELEILDEDECLRLLASAVIGRVATTFGALPVVLPVNFAIVDGGIVFRTGEGTKLRAATRSAVVAFEADDYDPESWAGWSVLAIGRSEEVTDPGEVSRLGSLRLAPWADGERTRYVRIDPDVLTGRRIVPQT
jgi:nitroimidazol reductase NimA-like FMN-containing flavoprotein (pyridoxamine 5'-phosphate oxidase superfamily)